MCGKGARLLRTAPVLGPVLPWCRTRVSGTAAAESKPRVFPAVLYKPLSSQTSLGAEHLQRGWSRGCSALSSPGCSCPAQGAWQSFLRERKISNQSPLAHFWELTPSKVCSVPAHQGSAMVGIPSPEQGEERSTELLEHGSSVQPGDTGCPSPPWGHRVSPQLWGRAVLTGAGFGPARGTQALPSPASSWGCGVTWAWLQLRLCCPSPLPNTAPSPAGAGPAPGAAWGWPWGVCVGGRGTQTPVVTAGTAVGAAGTGLHGCPPQSPTRAAPVMFLLLHVLFS